MQLGCSHHIVVWIKSLSGKTNRNVDCVRQHKGALACEIIIYFYEY